MVCTQCAPLKPSGAVTSGSCLRRAAAAVCGLQGTQHHSGAAAVASSGDCARERYQVSLCFAGLAGSSVHHFTVPQAGPNLWPCSRSAVIVGVVTVKASWAGDIAFIKPVYKVAQHSSAQLCSILLGLAL